NAPLSHAAGRLFDAFAALLGVAPERITHEGQAAIRLESLARTCGEEAEAAPYRSEEQPDGLLLIHWEESFEWGVRALSQGHSPARLALGLHRAVAGAACRMARHGAAITGEKTIYLSGGVFMNRLLNDWLIPMLDEAGLIPRTHGRIPPNDNGISLGQAVAAGRG
ncbi:MAG: carbamoyltransferase HypF, partial [Magnetococcales bacterium]|nr:carbamoyltransferase HypF [Magnetococcales bacterium]